MRTQARTAALQSLPELTVPFDTVSDLRRLRSDTGSGRGKVGLFADQLRTRARQAPISLTSHGITLFVGVSGKTWLVGAGIGVAVRERAPRVGVAPDDGLGAGVSTTVRGLVG